jgi:hypothetical protein
LNSASSLASRWGIEPVLSAVFSGQLLISGAEVTVLHGLSGTGRPDVERPSERQVSISQRFASSSEAGGVSPNPPRRDPAPRILRMTAGSCSSAISRRRPPKWAHCLHVDAERLVHQSSPAPGARTGGFHPRAVIHGVLAPRARRRERVVAYRRVQPEPNKTPGQRRRRGRANASQEITKPLGDPFGHPRSSCPVMLDRY